MRAVAALRVMLRTVRGMAIKSIILDNDVDT
jgi:hypothetical protein